MKQVTRRTLGLSLLCAFALVAADNPFVGTWKLNVAKSKFTPGTAPQSQTVTIGTDDKVDVSGVDGKGQPVNWSYTYAAGSAATITGMGAPDASVIETRKGNVVEHAWTVGKSKQVGRGVVSRDGKTMIYTLTGTDADGKTISDRSVYEKQ